MIVLVWTKLHDWVPKTQRVQESRAIRPGDLSPSSKILHRAAKGIKLHRIIVVSGELANRKVFN